MKFVKDVMLVQRMCVIALLLVDMQGKSGSLNLGLPIQLICHSLLLLIKELNFCQRKSSYCLWGCFVNLEISK